MTDWGRAEVELVCRAVAPDGDFTLVDEPDWDGVVAFARRHGVLPALHRGLGGANAVPTPVQERLDAFQAAQTTRNLRMAASLREIAECLEDEGVRALFVKGPVLAETAYGSLARRTFDDLDVLVPRGEFRRAVDALAELEYERTTKAPRLDDAAVLGGPVTPPLANEYALQHPETSVRVEVRWRPGSDAASCGLDSRALWARRTRVSVGGASVPALAPDDRLLYLAYHGSKHAWALLKWVVDVATVVDAAPELDWEALFERAREHGVERRLTVALGVARALLGTSVPGLGDRLAADERARGLVDEACRRFTADPGFEPAAVGTLPAHRAACDTLRARLRTRAATAAVHPSMAEYDVLPLPGALHPVYYALRPLRLLGNAVSQRRA